MTLHDRDLLSWQLLRAFFLLTKALFFTCSRNSCRYYKTLGRKDYGVGTRAVGLDQTETTHVLRTLRLGLMQQLSRPASLINMESQSVLSLWSFERAKLLITSPTREIV